MTMYHNILVYAMVNLGDVILTTSAIALLKKNISLCPHYNVVAPYCA